MNQLIGALLIQKVCSVMMMRDQKKKNEGRKEEEERRKEGRNKKKDGEKREEEGDHHGLRDFVGGRAPKSWSSSLAILFGHLFHPFLLNNNALLSENLWASRQFLVTQRTRSERSLRVTEELPSSALLSSLFTVLSGIRWPSRQFRSSVQRGKRSRMVTQKLPSQAIFLLFELSSSSFVAYYPQLTNSPNSFHSPSSSFLDCLGHSTPPEETFSIFRTERLWRWRWNCQGTSFLSFVLCFDLRRSSVASPSSAFVSHFWFDQKMFANFSSLLLFFFL